MQKFSSVRKIFHFVRAECRVVSLAFAKRRSSTRITFRINIVIRTNRYYVTPKVIEQRCLMKRVRVLPCNLRSTTSDSSLQSIFSFTFQPSLILCFHCLLHYRPIHLHDSMNLISKHSKAECDEWWLNRRVCKKKTTKKSPKKQKTTTTTTKNNNYKYLTNTIIPTVLAGVVVVCWLVYAPTTR